MWVLIWHVFRDCEHIFQHRVFQLDFFFLFNEMLHLLMETELQGGWLGWMVGIQSAQVIHKGLTSTVPPVIRFRQRPRTTTVLGSEGLKSKFYCHKCYKLTTHVHVV